MAWLAVQVSEEGWGWLQETQTQPIKVHVHVKSHIYTVGRPLSREVLFCFHSESLVTN